MPTHHAKVSSQVDGPDPLDIQPSDWNSPLAVDSSDDYTSSIHIDMRMTCAGDGAANDTTPWTNRLAAVEALGKHFSVYLAPDKIFLIDRWTHATAGVTVRFYGGGTIKLRTASDSVIKCTAGTVVLDGVRVDGNALAITAASNALVYSTGTGATIRCMNNTEIFNAGVAASSLGGGAASNLGSEMYLHNTHIHDVMGFGAHAQGIGKFEIIGCSIHNTGDSNIFVGPNNNGGAPTPPARNISLGGNIEGNVLTDARADAGGTGQHGNNINVFAMDNISIGPNYCSNPAFSFCRVNSCYSGTMDGITGVNAGENGIWCELGAGRYSITGCVVDGTQTGGITATNIASNPPLRNVVISGCEVYNFGQAALVAPYAGIRNEYGSIYGCIVDGNNNPSATWALGCSAGGGVGTSWQTHVELNDTAGCKYDVGVCQSVVAGTQRTIIGRNSNFRQDANYSSPIGAIAGGTSDGGNGSAIGNTMRPNIHWAGNYWNVPNAEKPVYGEMGSRMLIDNVWNVSDGVGWNPELTKCVAAVTYSASMTPVFRAMDQTATIAATNGTAFTINVPSVPGTPGPLVVATGAKLTIRIKATATLGVATFAAGYHLAGAWVQPANTFNRSITFEYDGTNWLELYRTSADVAN